MANNNIKAIVNAITKEYNTRNPFDLARCLGIYVHKNNDLGTISGCYLITPRKEKIIILNSSLNGTPLENFRMSQLLGHAILHEDEQYYLCEDNTYLPKNKSKLETHKFAAELLGIEKTKENRYYEKND